MLSLEQTLSLIKAASKCAGKNDNRDFVNYVYIISQQSNTELLATNGHIAIKVNIKDAISQIENTKLKIKFVNQDDSSVIRINKVFNISTEDKSTEITFNPNYLTTIFNAIKTACSAVKMRLIDIDLLAGSKDSVSKFAGGNGYISIEAAIMPMRKSK